MPKNTSTSRAKYVSGILNNVERDKLLSDYYQLEISRGTEVSIRVVEGMVGFVPFQVTITTIGPIPDFWDELVHASFRDGMMQQRGWAARFRRID